MGSRVYREKVLVGPGSDESHSPPPTPGGPLPGLRGGKLPPGKGHHEHASQAPDHRVRRGGGTAPGPGTLGRHRELHGLGRDAPGQDPVGGPLGLPGPGPSRVRGRVRGHVGADPLTRPAEQGPPARGGGLSFGPWPARKGPFRPGGQGKTLPQGLHAERTKTTSTDV